jgi:pectin methylesterase-like acyl-CoA thioesterase
LLLACALASSSPQRWVRVKKQQFAKPSPIPVTGEIRMPRLKSLFLVYAALALTVSATPVLAATYVVGTCKPKLPTFSSIQAAVNSAPIGTTVQVCPGTYAEQVTIPTPLTLVGISNGNSDDVVITVPTSGLTSVPGAFGDTVFAQVTADAGLAGSVNISNITLDGTGNGIDCQGWAVGIFYPSDASGTVNEVTVRNFQPTSCGYNSGTWFENGDSPTALP